MKRAKFVFVGLLALGILALAYCVGYRKAKLDDERFHIYESISKDVHIYMPAERGDLGTVKTNVEFYIFSDYNFYETHYGSEPVSGKFKEYLDVMRSIGTNETILTR